jgi:sugar O-acyltransferase (sialic acid O-acetyltransferase NeuD family)
MPFTAQVWEKNADLVFIETSPSKKLVNGYEVVAEEDFSLQPHSKRYFNVAVGDSAARARLAEKLSRAGSYPLSLISPTAEVFDCNEIAEGAILCGNVKITSNVKIGKFFHANLFSYVAHDCTIGDYVTFAPNVACNGNVMIGDHAYIGTGAVLKQGTREAPLRIGEGAVVGMGAVVTKDVAPFTTVVGNPARVLERR